MKIKLWIYGLAIILAVKSALAAESPSENLQKGLFEEEANHNLDAAIKAYQSVIRQTDEQRKLGATAIFRLGECYRKLDRTNDAVAQYRRLLREFPDQERLVQNSQQLLVELKAAPNTGASLSPEKVSPSTAAEAEELQRIRAVVKDSPDLVNAREPVGRMRLHDAASKGWVTVAEYLLDNHADVNATDNQERRSALHFAASSGHKSMVQLLIEHKAEVNAPDKSGLTPLHEAAQRGFKTVVEALLTGKADANARTSAGWTPLHYAARNGHRAVGEVLLKNKAEPDARTTGAAYVGAQNFGIGVTPLHVAASSDQAGFIELLCAGGADANARDEQLSTPLHYAATFASTAATIQALLHNKADPNAESKSHYTPLHQAVLSSRSKGIVEALLAAGARTDSISDDGKPILLSTIEQGQMDLARALLAAGANPNTTNKLGETPLHQAVRTLREPFVELLLTNRANPNVQTPSGVTPLHEIASAIRNNDDSRVPGMLDVLKLLLRYHADVNIRNNDGYAPLNYFGIPAKGAKPPEQVAITLLKEHGAIDEVAELAPKPTVIRVWRKGLSTGREVFTKDPAGRNRFTLLEALWSFYNTQQQQPVFNDAPFRPGSQTDPSYDFPDLSQIVVRRLVDGKTYRPIELNLLKGPGDPAVIDCERNVDLEFGDVIEIPEREHALGERAKGLDSKVRAQMQECVTQRVKLFVKGSVTELSLDPGGRRYLWAVLNKPEALKVIVSSSDFSKVKVRRHDSKTGTSEELRINLLDQRNGAKRFYEDMLLQDGDEIEVPEK